MIEECVAAGGPHVPLPRVVACLAEELGELAGLADSVQSAISLDRNADAADPAFLKAAQGLDLLTQKLEALHCFVRAMTDIVPADCIVDPTPATRLLTLASVAERLSCGRRTPVSDEVDFF